MPLKNPWLTNQPEPAPPIPGVEPPQARQAVAVTPPGEAVTYDQALVEARALAARRAEEDRRRKAAVRTEQWRAMDPQNSAVSHDDGEHQSWLETMVSSMSEAQKSTRDVLGFLMPDITGKRRKFLDEQERTTIGEIPSFPRYLGQGMEDVTRSELVYKKNILKKPLSEDEERQLAELTDKRNSRDPAQAAPKSIAGQVIRALPSSGHVFIQSLPAAADGGMIGATAGSAVPGVGTVAGAISGFSTGATVGSMGPSFKLNSAEAFEDFSAMRDEKGNPIPVDVVRAASIGYGVIATGLDTFAFSKELKLAGIRPGAINAGRIKQLLMDKPFRDGLQELVERLGPAAFYEGSTEGMQATVQYFIGKLAQADTTAKTGVDFKGDNPVEVAKGILNEGVVGGITGAAVVAPGATYQAVQQEQLANQAKAREQFLKSLGEGPDSKLKAELPEKYREYAEHLTRDGPVEDVYITASAFREYFQSQNVDPEEAAREMGLPPGEVARALSEGGEIKLPMADYLTRVVKTPAGEALMPHIKFAPGDLQMTSAEAADAAANKPTVMEALAAEGKAREDMSEAERKGRLDLRSEIGARLAADPDFTIGQIETTADNYVDQYYGLARVLDIPIDEVLTRFPIPNINAERGVGGSRPSAPQMRGGDLPDGYEARLVKRESGGNPSIGAKTSSALGLHQFVASTWIGVIKQHGLPGDPNAKAVAASIVFKDGRPLIVNEAQRALLARRTNAADSTAAFRAFTADNAKFLRGVLGRDPSAGELYTAHFLGNGGAQTLLKADDNAIARDLKGLKAAAAANTTIFYEGKGKDRRPRTVAEVKANLFATFEGVDAPAAGGEQMVAGPGAADTPIPDGPQAPEMGPGGETFDQFAGRKALTADMGKLRVAQLLEKRDASPEQIWKDTGWIRGPDQQWRFEIDDSQAVMKPDALDRFIRDDMRQQLVANPRLRTSDERIALAKEPPLTLGDVMEHEALFAAYPKLRNIPILAEAMPKGSLGAFDPSTGEIAVSQRQTVDGPIATILHEVQHVIQALEGFAGGAGPNETELRRQGYAEALDATINDMVATYPPAQQAAARKRIEGMGEAVYDTYFRSEGEIEARNTAEARLDMDGETRRAIFPDLTRDVRRGRGHVVKAPTDLSGRYLDALPNPTTRVLANAYRAKFGRTREAPLAPVEPDEGMMMRFADEFDAQISKPTDPAVIASYEAAASEVEEQAHFIVGHLVLERWNGTGEPYPNSTAMIEDVLLRGHFYFLPTERESFGAGNPEDMNHPFLRETELTDSNGTPLLVNDLFRIVHDVFAHTTGGAGFGPKGELNAFLEHASMFSDAALPAVAAETLMQNAWVNYGQHLRRPDGTLPKRGDSDYVGLADRRFSDQKAFLAPQWVLREVFQLQERSDREGRYREQEAALLGEYNRLREGQGLAPDATRIEPLAGPDGRVTLTHWGRRKNLKALDPRRWGDNATILTREERNAVENDDVPRRTYYGVDVGQPWGYEREDGLGPHRYTARIEADRLYDFDADPDGLKAKVVELVESGEWSRAERGSAYERVIADAGYAGYWSRHANLKMVAVVFERLAADYQGNGETTFYQEDVFYSGLGRAIEQAQTKKAPAAQWIATLQKTPGVKKEELEWSGVLDWLAGIEGPVEREALLAFVNSNGVAVEVLELGGGATNGADQVYDNGDGTYSLRTFSEERYDDTDYDSREEAELAAEEAAQRATQFSRYKLPGADDTYRELLFRLPNIDGPATHWDQSNVAAHARTTIRTDAEGNRVLFVEEVQSDWHQKGREQGYRSEASQEARAEAEENYRVARGLQIEAERAVMEVSQRDFSAEIQKEATYILGGSGSFAQLTYRNQLDVARRVLRRPEGNPAVEAALAQANLRVSEVDQQLDRLARGIPDAPFRTGWPALVMKRLIRYAVDQNLDRIAWTTGDQIGPIVFANSPEQRAGLNAFYGRNLVNIVNDLTKKYGVRVADVLVKVPNGPRPPESTAARAAFREALQAGETNAARLDQLQAADEALQEVSAQPGFTITPALADAARGGFTLFQREGGTEPTNDQVNAKAQELAKTVPGLKRVLRYLKPDEKAKLRKDTAAKMMKIISDLPAAEEMASVAFSGRAKRGWYEDSANALLEVFGLEDAPRFAALLAALSPQTSVEDNLANALRVWTAWDKAGRPTDRDQIVDLMGKNVQGTGTVESVLPSWINNSVTALTTEAPADIQLSGPKVNSFMLNLVGVVDEVTNDAWMANYALVDQAMFSKTGQTPGKGAGYIAMNALVRKAAEIVSKRLGEAWTPAEVQETVWSWARTLYVNRDKAGGTATTKDILAAGGLTHEDIGDTPDFALLFLNGIYSKILREGGYGDKLENLGSRGRAPRSTGGVGDATSPEGSGIDEATFRRHLERAAQRLEQLRTQRAQDAARKRVEAANPSTLAQREDGGGPGIRRGSIQMDRANFGKGVSSTVNLFVDRNLTTALHEGAHFFLEAMISTVRDGTATPLMVDMVNDLLGWFNVPTVDDIGRREHEMYAEAYEQYLYEGVAPAPRLRGQFSRIRVWMVAAYAKMGGRRLDVTDEVRSVFDRLLASQSEVEEARAMQGLEPLFADPASAGMDPVLAEAYQTVARRAKADADDEAAREIMAAVSREQKAWYRGERERVRAEVAAELAEDPGYQALDWLSRGKWIGAEQPTDLEPFKLSRPIIVSEYGADQLKAFPPSFGKVYAAEGVHPDFAAELFGFESGQALFDDWKGKPRRSDAVEQETDRRMLERYGDPMTDGTLPDVATDAVHNVSQQRLIELELEHLQGRPAFKGLRAAAERQAEDRTIKDLAGYDRHLANERRAANEAQRAFRAKDLTAAAQAKFRQLVAFHAWTVSRAAAKEVEKGQNLFGRVVGGKADRVAAARNMDYVMAARAILAAYGVGKASQNPLAYMAMIREYDPETAAMLEPEVLALLPTQPRTLESLTLNEFRGLAETVKSLYALSRKLKTIEIEGRVMELDAAALELGEQIFAVSKMPGGFEPTTSTSDGEKLLRGAAGIRNSIRRVESWARRMDGGTVGPFTRLLWRPISAAADDYRALSGDLRTRYAALLEMIRPTLTWKKISAPELGHVFADKSELLHAILHTGNESNKRKLLLGGSGKGGWVQLDENGEMQTGPWDNMIRRMADEGILTKADFDFAQAVWDLLDSTKPGAQRAHRKIVGRYFDEVTANEVQTPFGPYRGGYVPALADPTKVVDAGLRAEIESAVDGGGASMFPTTPRGFTKGRVENYTKPLALDLRLLAQHLDKVAMFTHLAAPVKDASRLLMHSDVREPLGQHDPAAMTDMLIPWLERTSRQIVQTPTRGLGGKLGDRFFASIRSRTGQQTMLGNVVNALQQLTGFTVAATLVKPTSLAKGLVTMMTSPAETAAAIAEASPMMKERMSAQTMEAAYGIEAILLRPNLYTATRQFVGKHAYFLQHALQNVVDTAVWVGAHGEALERGATDVEASKRADAVIRQTQGSLNPEDMSRWESGPAIARLFTQFASYFNMQSNLLLTEGGQALRDRNYARLAWVYMMGFAVPALMAEAIKIALRGEIADDEDDGWLDEWLDWFVGSQFRGATAMVPVVGPAINASANAFNDKPFDDKLSLSPGVSAVDSAIRTPKNIAQLMAGEGDWSRTAKDTLTLMGLAIGIPVGALNRPLGYGIDVMEGDVVPTDPLDAVRGAVTGAPSEASRQ